MKCTEIFDVVNLETEQIEAGMGALNHIEPTPLRSALVLPLYRGSSASSTTLQKYCPSRWRKAFQQVAGDTIRATSLKVVCGVHDQEQNCATLPAQVLSIQLLGNTADAGTQMQRTVLNKARKQSRTLLYLLALKPAHVLSREEAAQLLWPSAAREVVQARLYTVLSGLRKALKELGMDDALICSDSTIALNPERVRIDLDFFLQKLALILSQNTTYSKRCALMHEAVAQYKEGVFIRISKEQQSVFIQAHEEVERRFVDSLVVSARACEAQAYRSDALEFASLAWRLAPLREDVVEVYLRALSLNGRHDESEQYYQAYASKILAEKGSLPHLELKDVLVSGPTHTLSKPERPLRVDCVIES